MRCPKCDREDLHPPTPCSNCGFTGPPSQVEELAHVAYLLGEMAGWPDLVPQTAERLRTRYLRRRNELEEALGLRPPPLTPDEAHQAWWEINCLETLLARLPSWLERGWVHPDAAARLAEDTQQRIRALRVRLTDATPAPAFDSAQNEMARFRYLRRSLKLLHDRDGLVDETAYAVALASLEAEVEEAEIALGLRPRPEPAEPTAQCPHCDRPIQPGLRFCPYCGQSLEPVAVEEAKVKVKREPAPPPPPPRPPREPITWDRILQTVLSERTLRAMLFLGAFLFFAAGLVLIVFNWERFHPLVQLLIIVIVTCLFYLAGWYVRTRMKLRLSGMAITATGSLLVPLDFYAVYMGGGFQEHVAAEWVWLIASVFCLVVYTFTAWSIQAEFFGYLVAAAAGSLLCATMWVAGVSPDWVPAALCALALASTPLTERLRPPARPQVPVDAPDSTSADAQPAPADVSESTPEDAPAPAPADVAQNRWGILYRPLWHAALLTVTTILPLALGWYVFGWAGGNAFRASLAASWWLGSGLYAFGAWRHRFQALGLAAAAGLPVAAILTLAPILDQFQIAIAWHALGWALLTPFYLVAGRRLRASSDEVTRAHGRTALAGGIILVLVSAAWSFFSPFSALDAATATHAVLALTMVLAVWLWRRPRLLLVASFFSLVSITAGMWARELTLAQLGLGWSLLAVLHLGVAVRLREKTAYASPVYVAGLALAALSLLPPLVGLDRGLLIYALGNWVGLAAWVAWVAHTGQHLGLTALLRPFGRLFKLDQRLPHWAVALPLPILTWLVWTHDWQGQRLDPAWLGVALAVLAWGLVFLGRWLARRQAAYGLPWYVTGYLTSVAAPIAGLLTFTGDRSVLALVFLLVSGLYFASAWRFRQRWWLLPAGVTLPIAWVLFLGHHHVEPAPTGALLALVPALYLLGGALLVVAKRVEDRFFLPLNVVAHGLAALAVQWSLVPLENRLLLGVEWGDPDRLWAAAGLLALAVAYGLAAWAFRREWWAHAAAWLCVAGGGIAATVFSEGRGSSAAKAALGAVAYVLAERAFFVLRDRWAHGSWTWRLYRRPLLVAGWSVSAGAIALALYRNLLLLGGGWTQRTWAVVALAIIVGLYALSAWMFRRVRFVWLAGVLAVAPWTILTHLGWFVLPEEPHLPAYALAWLALAWVQLVLALVLEWRGVRAYGVPLHVVGHVLVPFSLLWCVADVQTAYVGWGLGVGFYVVSAIADHRRMPGRALASRFIYPAAALTPIWALYLLAQFAPTAEHIHYGLLLLAFGPVGLLAGILLRRVHPADALPAYLAAYGSALVGTLLVAHDRPWLVGALLLDTALCVFSAWYHKEPLWNYPASALPIVALLLTLNEFHVDPNRHGWALIALGTIYLALAHGLRLLKHGTYAVPLMAVAYVSVALGLPPSSRDYDGAFWGYSGAAVLYAFSAWWLRQPLFLTPALALAAVPYGVTLYRSSVEAADYGLWLWPGIAVALAAAHGLDKRLGAPRDFLWDAPARWFETIADRWLVTWPALPFYVAGYLGTLVAMGLSILWGDVLRLSAALALAAAVYALAIPRFRLRFWLLAAVVAGQLAALALVDCTVWLRQPAHAALAFLPVTTATALLGLLIERRRGESSPFAGWLAPAAGWSRPLYLLLAIDLLVGQAAALTHSGQGGLVTLGHALLVAVLASAWALPLAAVTAAGLGLVSLVQGLDWYAVPQAYRPVALVTLALAYGLAGYGLALARRRGRALPGWLRVWEEPLAGAGLGIATIAALLALMVGHSYYASVTLALTAAAYAVGMLHFRRRFWLLATGTAAQLAALALINYTIGLQQPAHAALAFLPVTAATALLGLLIEWRCKEGSPFVDWQVILDGWIPGNSHPLLAGWSRPLYLLLAVDLLVGQAATLAHSGPGSLVSLGHAVLVGVLASVWVISAGAVVAAVLGLFALLQGLGWYQVPAAQAAVWVALLALVYGVVGYVLVYARRRGLNLPRWLQPWDRSLAWTGLGVTTMALATTPVLGMGDVVWLVIRALFEQPVLGAQAPTVQMMVAVLAVAGLTYLIAALAERQEWLGYGAVAMLLSAYGLQLLLFWGQREVQWYAVPAGVYLLGVGYLEWHEGRRGLARWIDRAALLLLLGSSFWQSLSHAGWEGVKYAALMGVEGVAVFFWGSARRQLRFLYTGVIAVLLAVVGQGANVVTRSFNSLNAALVLAAAGLLLLLIALFVESRLEWVRKRMQDAVKRFEDWE